MREIKFRAWHKELQQMYLPDKMCLTIRAGVMPGDGDYDFMQYTGLKDKNGKEIFEGDIIKDPLYGNIGEVEYELNVMEDGYGSKMGSGFFPTIDAQLCECEVIGNIHENKELLK